MSTERTRQRAIQRSLIGASSSVKRKYHFSEFYDDTEIGDWRGVVLPPFYEKTGKKRIESRGCRLNYHGILSHLFYWERISIPRPDKKSNFFDEHEISEYCHNQTVSFNSSDYLFKFGGYAEDVIENYNPNKPRIRRSELLEVEQLEWEHQVQTFKILDKKSPGNWSICDPNFYHKSIKESYGRSLMVRLYDAIPVPVDGISLLDVLEFKNKYRDDLSLLRRSVDEMFLCIENHHEKELSFKIQFEKIKEEIIKITELMEKNKIYFRFVDIDVRLKWEFDAKLSAIAAASFAALADLEAALAAGVLSNLIPKVEIGVAPGALPGDKKSSYRYAYLMSKEFGNSVRYASLSDSCLYSSVIKNN